jgi:threonine/homoserine/homoserine lactone efflux protein
LYFAHSIWRSASQVATARPILFGNPIVLGLVTNAMNPKSVLFASSVLLAIFPQNMTIMEDGLIVANHVAMEVMFYAGITFILSRKGIAPGYLNAKSTIDRIFSGLLAALSFYILYEVLVH